MTKIEDWANSVRKSFTKSETAKAPKAIRDAIREFLQLKAEGKTTISVARFHKEYLMKKLGYPLGVSALRSYMIKFEPELYERISNNDG